MTDPTGVASEQTAPDTQTGQTEGGEKSFTQTEVNSLVARLRREFEAKYSQNSQPKNEKPVEKTETTNELKNFQDEANRRITALQDQLNNEKLNAEIIRVLSRYKFIDNAAYNDAYSIIKNSPEIKIADGEISIVNNSNETQYNAELKPMTLDEFITNAVSNRKYLLATQAPNGTGTIPPRGTAPNTALPPDAYKPDVWSKLTQEQKDLYASQHKERRSNRETLI